MRQRTITPSIIILGLLTLAGCGSSTTPDATTPGSGGSASGVEQKAPPPPPPLVLSAGTVIPVTIDQTVGTKNNEAGDPFEASVATAVSINGNIAIPQGAKASGHVTTSYKAGRVKGGARLVLNLDSVTIHGQVMQVHTASVVEVGKGRGQRTAIGAGAGAAAGAIIGAIAGGGKGAAIGAGAGAGAGTAGTVFTGNRDITVPAETRLNFKLTEDLEIPAE